ncbi:MAG: CoA pyrophosphatase [Rhizobiaceae bacterium]|nr:CoA pyrophosphatase [Rhizobiaceae bacterium]
MDETALRPFSSEDFRRRAALATHPADNDEFGDHRLNPDLRDLIIKPDLRDAAVLVPVVDHAHGATVILTQRTTAMRSHSGQIAFPGGKIDAEDPSPEDAALREAEEEIGLSGAHVDIIGRLPDYVSGSGYRIAPVLSVVRPGFDLTINPDEVDDAFEVPLAFLMDPANHRRQSRIWNERERFFYEMPFGDRYIWGVTAGIIRTLYERLYA